jgi:hypothetical protein
LFKNRTKKRKKKKKLTQRKLLKRNWQEKEGVTKSKKEEKVAIQAEEVMMNLTLKNWKWN